MIGLASGLVLFVVKAKLAVFEINAAAQVQFGCRGTVGRDADVVVGEPDVNSGGAQGGVEVELVERERRVPLAGKIDAEVEGDARVQRHVEVHVADKLQSGVSQVGVKVDGKVRLIV